MLKNQLRLNIASIIMLHGLVTISFFIENLLRYRYFKIKDKSLNTIACWGGTVLPIVRQSIKKQFKISENYFLHIS